MEKKNTGLVILVIFLVLALLGTSGFIIYDKLLLNNKSETEDIKQETNKENNDNIEITSLSKEYKSRINKDLKNIPISSMNDLSLRDYTIGKNIFDDELEKYNFAYWHIIYSLTNTSEYHNNTKSDCGYLLDGDTIVEKFGCIKISYIQNIYKEIFNDNFNENILSKNGDIFDKTTLKDGYVNLPMAAGGTEALMKAKKLSYDKSLNEYSLTVDFLDLSDKNWETMFNDDYTEYDESLVESSAIIKYKEIEGRKVLTSWVYIK